MLIEKAEVEVKANVGTEHCSVPTEALTLTFMIINFNEDVNEVSAL